MMPNADVLLLSCDNSRWGLRCGNHAVRNYPVMYEWCGLLFPRWAILALIIINLQMTQVGAHYC